MRGVTKEVLRNYLERCATDAIRSGDTAIYDELMEAIYKFVKEWVRGPSRHEQHH